MWVLWARDRGWNPGGIANASHRDFDFIVLGIIVSDVTIPPQQVCTRQFAVIVEDFLPLSNGFY